MNNKVRELTRILVKWNRNEITADKVAGEVWKLYEKEVLETWNNPLESLIYEDGN